MAAAPSQPISIGRLPSHPQQSLLSANHPSNPTTHTTTTDHHLNAQQQQQHQQQHGQPGASGTSPAYSYLGADLAAQNPRWAGTSASPARNTQELSTSWTIHPGPLFISSPHLNQNQSLSASTNFASTSSAVSVGAVGFNINGGAGASAAAAAAMGSAGSLSGSYTGAASGTPMSLSNSFYSRFLPQHAPSSSSSPSFGGPGVLNPLDPTDFKFSSSPYGGRAWGGGGYGSYSARGLSGSYGRSFVGSVESDRMSILEGFYGGKGEKEAVSGSMRPFIHSSFTPNSSLCSSSSVPRLLMLRTPPQRPPRPRRALRGQPRQPVPGSLATPESGDEQHGRATGTDKPKPQQYEPGQARDEYGEQQASGEPG